MKMFAKLTSLVLAASTAFAAAASSPFIDHSMSSADFLSVEVHGLIGGSQVTQNYVKRFTQITDLDLSMRTAGGIGARAELSITGFVALGVEANLLFEGWKMNVAVADDDARSMTNCFLRNRMTVMDFPVFGSAQFNLGTKVRWLVDLGIYYDYGVSGSQKQRFYNASINQGNQLVTQFTDGKVGYYNSSRTFVNSSYRSDWGLHLGTGLVFNRRVSVGIRFHAGFKNVAHVYDAVITPSIHRMSVMGTIGYRL